ncbi:hypothetical protein KSP39_PZI004557 [Platanthera zijinensis]|uniref:Uncharacterized protein n=1 Tax=Platanthera zijinensis TaxID=2320716 RepID=A0AAP0BW45_9ASPA
MLSHHSRLQDFAAGNHFTFSPVSETNEYGAWAENLKTLQNPFDKRDPHRKFGPWVRTIPLPESALPGESDYNASSPPLLKSAPPESRAQVIANYREEMMDLVRGLPETSYELSLTDIVEFPARQMREKAEEEEAALTESEEIRKGGGKRRTATGIKSRIKDSGSFLLNIVMPNLPAVTDGAQTENSGRGSKISPRLIEYGKRSSSKGSSDSGCSVGGRHRWYAISRVLLQIENISRVARLILASLI